MKKRGKEYYSGLWSRENPSKVNLQKLKLETLSPT